MVYIPPEIVHKINSLPSIIQRSSGIMIQLFPLALDTLSQAFKNLTFILLFLAQNQ